MTLGLGSSVALKPFVVTVFLVCLTFAAESSQPDKALTSEDSKMPKWNCRVDTPRGEKGFTVGDPFLLICEGPAVDFHGQKGIHFQMPEPLLYAIRVLSVDKVTRHEVVFTATSYLAGQHDLRGLVVVEELQEKFNVNPFQLTIESVLKDPKQKPYGPLGALSLGMPRWFWLLVGGLLLTFLFYGLFVLQRRSKRLKVIEELKRHNTALGPFNQLNKDLRHLSRKNIFTVDKNWDGEKVRRYISNLDDIFRLYLLREFIVPALDWKTNLVMKEIKRSDKKSYAEYENPLRKFLKELDRAKKDIDKVEMEDCQQLTQMARRVSQTVWKTRRAKGGQ